MTAVQCSCNIGKAAFLGKKIDFIVKFQFKFQLFHLLCDQTNFLTSLNLSSSRKQRCYLPRETVVFRLCKQLEWQCQPQNPWSTGQISLCKQQALKQRKAVISLRFGQIHWQMKHKRWWRGKMLVKLSHPNTTQVMTPKGRTAGKKMFRVVVGYTECNP